MKVKTMRGVDLDVTALMAKHETLVAAGNARMNARGDIVGVGGQIIKRREDAAQEYYQSNPKAVHKVSLRDVKPDVFQPADAWTEAKSAAADRQTKAKTTRKIIDSK